eukprot:1248234-Rhodomonas_salina.1
MAFGVKERMPELTLARASTTTPRPRKLGAQAMGFKGTRIELALRQTRRRRCASPVRLRAGAHSRWCAP